MKQLAVIEGCFFAPFFCCQVRPMIRAPRPTFAENNMSQVARVVYSNSLLWRSSGI